MKLLLPLFTSYAEKIAYLEDEVLKLERYVVLAGRSESWARVDALDDLLSQAHHALALEYALRWREHTRRSRQGLRSLEHTK